MRLKEERKENGVDNKEKNKKQGRESAERTIAHLRKTPQNKMAKCDEQREMHQQEQA